MPPPGYGQYAPQQSPYGTERPPLASWGKRVLAYLIDQVLPTIAAYLLFIILSVISDVLGILGVIALLAAFGFGLYSAYLAGQSGQSYGMKQMGIRLLDEGTGQPVGGGLGIARYFVHVVDSVTCYVGWLFPLWDAKKQTLTDKIFNHVVIEDQRR